jgi:hypothetical protein
MTVLILSTQSGDWEGLFIDGKLIDEAEYLGEGNSRLYMLKKAEEFGFKSSDVISKTLTDEDDETLSDNGHFPKELSELDGFYIV